MDSKCTKEKIGYMHQESDAINPSYIQHLKSKHKELIDVLSAPGTGQETHKRLMHKYPNLKIDPATTQAHITFLKGAGLVKRGQIGRKYVFCTDQVELSEFIRNEAIKGEQKKHAELISRLTAPMSVQEVCQATGRKQAAVSTALKKLSSLGIVDRIEEGKSVIYIANSPQEPATQAA